jgi:hypothetical protein
MEHQVMPDFTFQGPGGRSITITGPEGATEEQAIGILRQQHPELWGSETSQSTAAPKREIPEWAKFGRGVERGVSGAAANISRFLPGPIITEPFLKGAREFGAGGEHEGSEQTGRITGEIGSTLMIPGLGATSILGRLAEAAMMGGAGGLMTPADSTEDTAKNIGVGGTAAAATSGAGILVNAVPQRYRWLVNMAAAGAATKALHEMGIPSGWWSAPMWWGLYRARLGDLARRYFSGATQALPGVVGSTAAHIREGVDNGR